MDKMKPTFKQMKRVQKIVKHLGEEKVLSYIRKFYPAVESLSALNKVQAQKIHTGLSRYMPTHPISKCAIPLGYTEVFK